MVTWVIDGGKGFGIDTLIFLWSIRKGVMDCQRGFSTSGKWPKKVSDIYIRLGNADGMFGRPGSYVGGGSRGVLHLCPLRS